MAQYVVVVTVGNSDSVVNPDDIDYICRILNDREERLVDDNGSYFPITFQPLSQVISA